MSPPEPIKIGDVVAGKYRLLDIIGEGGMGVVYLAEHSLIEKRVALKVLRSEYSTKAEVVSRFQQEAISASRIKHPNVLDVFDFGKLEDGSFFLAMEYLQGRDLAGELSESTFVAPDRVLRIALQMTRALAAAHARGVVHRDLKPENVFLHQTEDGDEVVKIVDFGIAQLKGKEDSEEGQERRRRLTRTGMIFGTPEYMSPEQAAGRAVDLRADIYATGVMLYEMFTGAVPFTGTSFMAVLSAHLTQTVPRMREYLPQLAISPQLEAAVMRALEKNPDARFQSMRELASALQQTPEGRAANPLSGLLPVPEVTVQSFRPARGGRAATTPEFGKAEPMPFNLVARELPSERSHPRPSEPLGSRLDLLHEGAYGGAVDGNEEVTLAPPSARYAPFQPPRRRGKVWVLIVALLAVAAATTVGYRRYQTRIRAAADILTNRASDAKGTGVAPTATGPSASVTAAADGTTPTPEVATAANDARPSSGAAASTVVLSVQTNLPGATLSKDGFQVCDQTPCTVDVRRGEATELVAAKGYARGSAKVLAQKDQSVVINLVYAKGNAKKRGAGSSDGDSSDGNSSDGSKADSTKSKLCEVTVDGLKILRPCQ